MYLYGASGHAKVISDILKENNILVEGVYDDNTEIKSFVNFPLLGSCSDLGDNKEFIISIGNNIWRKKIVDRIPNALYGKAVSQSANQSPSVMVGEGTVIMKGVSVNADAIIGKHVILNTNCSVDHDCVIGDFVHISPNVALCGDVLVGEGTHIGVGTCVIQGVKIGKWVTVGAGAVIIGDIPDYAVVVGNPGKIVKYNIVEDK